MKSAIKRLETIKECSPEYSIEDDLRIYKEALTELQKLRGAGMKSDLVDIAVAQNALDALRRMVDFADSKHDCALTRDTIIGWRDTIRAALEAKAVDAELLEALKDAQNRLKGAGMLGGKDDPVNAAITRAEAGRGE